MSDEIRCDIPNTDAVRLFATEKALAAYLGELGNPEFERVGNVVTIPEFAEGRRLCRQAKQIECDRWEGR